MRTPLARDIGVGDRTPGGVVFSASAYRNGALTPSSTTKVSLDTALDDPGGYFNLSSGSFIAPAKGRYHVDWVVGVNGSTNVETWLNLNGNQCLLGGCMEAGVAPTMATGSGSIRCNQGDYIELYIWVPAGSGMALVNSSTRNLLAVQWLGN